MITKKHIIMKRIKAVTVLTAQCLKQKNSIKMAGLHRKWRKPTPIKRKN
jgi:hypothetical protein